MERLLMILAERGIGVENLCQLEPQLWSCFLRRWEYDYLNRDVNWGSGRGHSAEMAVLVALEDFGKPRIFVPLKPHSGQTFTLEEIELDDLSTL